MSPLTPDDLFLVLWHVQKTPRKGEAAITAVCSLYLFTFIRLLLLFSFSHIARYALSRRKPNMPVRCHWQNYEKSLEVPKSFRFKFLIYGNLFSDLSSTI